MDVIHLVYPFVSSSMVCHAQHQNMYFFRCVQRPFWFDTDMYVCLCVFYVLVIMVELLSLWFAVICHNPKTANNCFATITLAHRCSTAATPVNNMCLKLVISTPVGWSWRVGVLTLAKSVLLCCDCLLGCTQAHKSVCTRANASKRVGAVLSELIAKFYSCACVGWWKCGLRLKVHVLMCACKCLWYWLYIVSGRCNSCVVL